MQAHTDPQSANRACVVGGAAQRCRKVYFESTAGLKARARSLASAHPDRPWWRRVQCARVLLKLHLAEHYINHTHKKQTLPYLRLFHFLTVHVYCKAGSMNKLQKACVSFKDSLLGVWDVLLSEIKRFIHAYSLICLVIIPWRTSIAVPNVNSCYIFQ